MTSNAALSFLYCPATCASCGSSGLGQDNKACRDNKVVRRVKAGLEETYRKREKMTEG